ncbi:MAG: TonB family protein [Sulfuricella sp.]
MKSGQHFNSTPHSYMPEVRISILVALALSLGFHAGLLALSMVKALPHPQRSSTVSEPLQVSLVIAPIQGMRPASTAGRTKPARLEHLAVRSLDHATKPRSKPSIPKPPSKEEKEHARIADSIPPPPTPEKKLASMPAPPPPTPEEWKLASTYTLKNSKRYRYNWGQLVRSMMGTAVEGPQQGQVRFHIEIAPDGKIAKVEVLWATSEIAEKLALQAIRSLPPLPPTPTGKPLIFDKTIAFEPIETGWPPIYKYDCLPDPPSFHNPFAWDGSSTQHTSQEHPENASPLTSAPAQAECPPDSTSDSLDAEDKDMKRQFDIWGVGRLNGVD